METYFRNVVQNVFNYEGPKNLIVYFTYIKSKLLKYQKVIDMVYYKAFQA
jgi:hypothetical protein